MAQLHKNVLRALETSQENQELSIIKISKPISASISQSTGPRESVASGEGLDDATPATLEADLAHYKELFSKLRFSYLEQVTKEKFIRSIVGDPPLIVENQENLDLEEQLVAVKAMLKSQKNEVANMVAELERHGRELSRKHESIQLQTTQLQELPGKIEELQASIQSLKEAQAPGPNPLLNMSLEKTRAMIEEKDRESAELDNELERLQAALPIKTRELERLEAELQPLEVRRLGSAASAREAQRRKEQALNGAGDDLEERGRWWRGVEGGLKGMLGVEN